MQPNLTAAHYIVYESFSFLDDYIGQVDFAIFVVENQLRLVHHLLHVSQNC